MSFPTKFLQQLHQNGYALEGYLLVFVKCVCLYALCGDGGASLTHTVAKCAPIVVLALCCLFVKPSAYSTRIALGLLLSACGDALLLWDQLAAGMACFAAAHVGYLTAFPRTQGLWTRAAVLVVVACIYIPQLNPPGIYVYLVPVYTCVLCGMCWRAGGAGRCAGGGGVLFVLSDAALGCHMFGVRIPWPKLTVMSTYYAAQLLLALSAILPRTETTPASPAAAVTASVSSCEKPRPVAVE